MHVVHVNQKYDTQEKALLENDGVVILAFLFIVGSVGWVTLLIGPDLP